MIVYNIKTQSYFSWLILFSLLFYREDQVFCVTDELGYKSKPKRMINEKTCYQKYFEADILYLKKCYRSRNCENGVNITYLLQLECYLNLNANTASDVIIGAPDQSNYSITCCAVVTNNNQQYSLFWWYARLINYLQVSILLSFERLSTPTTWFLEPQQMALCCLWCDGSHCENTLIQV